jgi:hypothetical protein
MAVLRTPSAAVPNVERVESDLGSALSDLGSALPVSDTLIYRPALALRRRRTERLGPDQDDGGTMRREGLPTPRAMAPAVLLMTRWRCWPRH